MKTIKKILLVLLIMAAGTAPVSAHMFSSNNWTWLYSDSEVSIYEGRETYDVERDQLSCYLGYRYPARNYCRIEFTTFDYYYHKYIVTYYEEYDDNGHELNSCSPRDAQWEDVEENDGTLMGLIMKKADDNSSRDYQLLYYDPRTHPRLRK